MERKWTPEPWSITGMTLVDDAGKEFNDISIVSEDDTWLAHMTQRSTPGLDDENAARIVTCVNALAGIEDPAAHLAELTAERDRMREAIQAVTDRVTFLRSLAEDAFFAGNDEVAEPMRIAIDSVSRALNPKGSEGK